MGDIQVRRHESRPARGEIVGMQVQEVLIPGPRLLGVADVDVDMPQGFRCVPHVFSSHGLMDRPMLHRLVRKVFPGPVTLIVDVTEEVIESKLRGLGLE